MSRSKPNNKMTQHWTFPGPKDIIGRSKPLEPGEVHILSISYATQDNTGDDGEIGAVINNDTLDGIMIVTTNLTDSS